MRNVMSWDCICDCGNTKTAAAVDLRRGHTTSCGCQQFKGVRKDITGQKRGSLIAISSTGVKCGNGDYKWNFICDCGNTQIKSIGAFNSKEYPCCKLCGEKRRSASRTTHGFDNGHKTYRTWCKIKERCFSAHQQDFKDYGAKGITVEQYFLDDFMNFYNYIGEAPDDGQKWSIDRVDHTRNYERGNIRWATDTQQARNKGKMKNNSSGCTGVQWDNKTHPSGKNSTLYASAVWAEFSTEGVSYQRKKAFSTKKYGIMEAFCLATQYRENKLKELNELGYGYADNHGK
jgi:hypothetical protein